jgi:hypothetical protein
LNFNLLCRLWHVVTLALDLRPRQGVARLWAKREAQHSHCMLSKVQRVWGLNSHRESCNPNWILEPSKRNCKGQNPIVRRFLYFIWKLLKCKCLKWSRMIHLNISNINYDQKKGRESNWQFDSRPLKVRNRLDFLGCCEPYRHNLVRKSQFLRVTSELFEWGKVIKGF